MGEITVDASSDALPAAVVCLDADGNETTPDAPRRGARATSTSPRSPRPTRAGPPRPSPLAPSAGATIIEALAIETDDDGTDHAKS